MTFPSTLSPALEKELAGTPELAQMKKEQLPGLDKPSLGDIEDLYRGLQPVFAQISSTIQTARDVRYMRDQAPKKWADDLQDGRRVYSRLSHNEGMRLTAMATRNMPKGRVAPMGEGTRAVERANKQTRWGNRLLPAFQRRAQQPLWRMFVDKVLNDGFAGLELYLTNSKPYDDQAARKAKQVMGDDGQLREETPQETVKRIDESLVGAPNPIGLRVIDALALRFPLWGDDGLPSVMICEKKKYRDVYGESLKRLGADALEKARLPKPGDRGWPTNTVTGLVGPQTNVAGAWITGVDQAGDVETIRYYDAEWYAFIVGGIFVEGPSRHGFPFLPVYVCQGQVTGSPNFAEATEGVSWGSQPLEMLLNDMLTMKADNAFKARTGRRVGIERPNESMQSSEKVAPTLDLSKKDSAVRGRPGEKFVMLEVFQPPTDDGFEALLLQLHGRNSQNPISQGQSPGANTPGYVVNTLSAASNSNYEGALDNLANAAAWICDSCRAIVKHTIKEKVYLPTPKQGTTKAVEMLGIGPDDIDDTPSEFSIDPMDDLNRLAIQQGLRQGNKEGYVKRARVQEEGYGIDDPEAEDDEIIQDAGEQSLAAMVVQDAMQMVAMIKAAQQPAPPPAAPTILGPDGQPLPPSSSTQNGTAPAPPQAPTVGGEQAAASQQPFQTRAGPAAQSASAAQGGQGQQSNNGLQIARR